VELPRADQKMVVTFTREHVRRLLLATANEYNRELQERDKAIIRVLLSTGIRASELCGLTLDHTHLDMYDAHIRVTGKGRKQREIGLATEARKQLYRYVTRWRRSPTSHTFVNRAGDPMTPDGLDQMLYRLRDWSGVSGVRVSAHTFQHTFAVEFLRTTGDLYRLKTLLGHVSVTTTQIYLAAYTSTEARRGVEVFNDL
jgi:site-specific recombinase XerD